jgi:type IV pilus assembly protein PilM
LSTLSAYFPNPEREYGLDPDNPEDQDELEKLRVYIDAVKPVWREDVSEWFGALDPKLKLLMHPFDAANPPTGPGWIIQVVGHHYNPFPKPKDKVAQELAKRKIDYGPVEFITEKVMKTLNTPQFRLYGVKAVALGWMTIDKAWTSGEGNKLANSTVPLLARASAPVEAAGEGGGGMGGAGMGRAMREGGMGMGGAMGGGMGRGGMGGGGMGRGGRGMMGMEGGFGPTMTDAEAKKKIKTLSRTDFLIQFVWQPTPLDDASKTEEERKEERKTALAKIREEMTQAEKNNPAVTIPKEEEIDAVSRKASQVIDSAINNALGAPAAPGAAAGAGAAPLTPGAVMPPGAAPTPPPAAPAKPAAPPK